MHKTKDRVTRTPRKTGGELVYSGKVSSSFSASDVAIYQGLSELNIYIAI
jgi:hypothetical protein